jgi:transposase-like protein
MGEDERPVGGVDYPRTFDEFDAWFGTEAACLDYIARLRWPGGFRCPSCGRSGEPWSSGRGLFLCRACRHQASATAGSLFHRTHKPLRTWFLAMWFVTSQKHGASALGVQRVLGLGSYRTAWSWLHKLRRAMVRPGRDRLQGEVEVDETYVGGPEEGVHGRQTEGKAIVAVAAENRGRAIGRIRLRRVDDVSAQSLTRFVQDAVEPGSVVHTDGWSGYAGLGKLGFTHARTTLKGSGQAPHELMPRVHRVASLLKRWLLGTHQGGVQDTHLEYYLDEFTFRFNRRRSRARGMLFFRLMQQAVACEPVPYRSLVGGASARDSGDHHNM